MNCLHTSVCSVFWRQRITKVLAAACLLLGMSFGRPGKCQDTLLGLRLRPTYPGSHCDALAFTHDSERLFVGNTNGKITILDVRSGRALNSFSGPEFLGQVVLSPRGDMLAGICWDFEDVRLWNTTNWAPLPPLRTQDRVLRCMAISPDGKKLAVGCKDKELSILLFDLAKRELTHALKGHGNIPCSLSFSPDSAILASVADEIRGSPVILWDVRKGERVKVIISHPTNTNRVVFLPGGTRLASSGVEGPMHDSVLDATVKIWDVASWTNLQTLRGRANVVLAMVALPGEKLVTGSADRSLRVWDLNTSCRRIMRRSN